MIDWQRTEVLAFRVPAIPPSKTQQAGVRATWNGRFVRKYKTADYQRQERNTLAVIMEALPDGWEPIDGPVEVRLALVWPYRKSEPKKRTADGGLLPHFTRPDVDNLAKGIIDALTTAAVWRDDGQIARMVLEKAWGPRPYWEVRVAKLELI